MPIQGALTRTQGRLEIFTEYAEGLKDIEGFSHLILLYHFHQARGFSLTAVPFLDDTPRGVFSIRGPRRPNPIGMTVVRLLERSGRELKVQGVDMLDGTPLLDIKPYMQEIDAHEVNASGWVGKKMGSIGSSKKADDRFS
jgi:tRNA-Thr(GGU) m(6)t(6)A37 methyltransferase TsaA